MKTIIYKFLILFFILGFSSVTNAQSVSIKMKRPPLNQLGVADLYNIDLTNTTNQQIQFYLFGTLSESKAGLIASAITVPISLGPNEKKSLKVNDLSKVPDVSYPHPDSRYKDALMRKGKLPNGDYTICVYAKETGSNEEIGNDCLEHSVEVDQESEITLLTPENNSSIEPD
ncbi:MAG: hypothetical protein IAE65_12945, partial [Ignavibacteria bacterium]|nr:hypothetical protein [Ignavibacteria bacterium]